MRFSTLLSLALPLLVAAESSTTTYTSTQTQTKTITISEVVASVTSTYSVPHNTSSIVGTASYYTSITSSAPTTTAASGPAPTKLPADVAGSASSINAMYAGSAGMLVMLAAALL